MLLVNNQRKLRNYLINFDIQRKVVVINLIFMLLVMIMTLAVIRTHILENTMGQIFEYGTDSMTFSLSGKLYIALVVTFFLSIAVQLWITHRVCGALVNFKKTFKSILNGDLGRKIQLRKGDLLEEEAQQFNRMMENIEQQIAALMTDNEKLRSEIKTLLEGSIDG